MRTSDKKLNPSLEKQIINTLARTINDFKSTDEVDLFLNDFFTDSENIAFAKRLAVAYWLKKGRSYTNIRNNLKVSSATIAEVSSLLKKKGMQLALQKIEAEEWANQWASKIRKLTKGIK